MHKPTPLLDPVEFYLLCLENAPLPLASQISILVPLFSGLCPFLARWPSLLPLQITVFSFSFFFWFPCLLTSIFTLLDFQQSDFKNKGDPHCLWEVLLSVMLTQNLCDLKVWNLLAVDWFYRKGGAGSISLYLQSKDVVHEKASH